MKCPNCQNELQQVNQQGVPVDFCPSCKGMFLDEGKVNYFVANPMALNQKLAEGLINESESSRLCPKCEVPMTKGGLMDRDLEVNRCPACKGMFFDTGELPELSRLSSKVNIPRAERLKMSGMSMAALAADASLGGKLPSLFLRSAAVLFFLYGIVFAFFFVLVEVVHAPMPLAFLAVVAFAALQFIISPFIMDFSLTVFQGAKFVNKNELPAELANFIENQASINKIPFPRMAVIEDGNPNAFTYGHTPKDARIVLTRGLMDLLKEDELEAVVAHEIGHAVHWDMLVMTAAMLVPTLLYMIYRIGFTLASNSKAKKATKKIGDQIIILAIVAFVLYVISEYIVLFLSRTREYYADRFSGVVTNNPNALARGLVKVAYGLAGNEAKVAAQEQEQPKKRFSLGTLLPKGHSAVRALGIFNPGSARALAAVAVSGSTRRFSVENMKGAMQWDLWNPWAGWYELHSTHPLPAKRILALGKQATAMGQQPLVEFDREKPESYWDDFLLDLMVYALPVILPLLAVIPAIFMASAKSGSGAGQYGGLFVAAFGVGLLIRVVFRYRSSNFPGREVSDLIDTVKVSGVRPVPATLKGKIIGRGIPGLVWSEDMVLQDESGFMFLDYKQPLKIIEFLFGLFRTKGLIGKDVTVKGWYRRSPMPYFEMKELAADGKTHTCYVYHVKMFLSLLIIAIGAALMVTSLGLI